MIRMVVDAAAASERQIRFPAARRVVFSIANWCTMQDAFPNGDIATRVTATLSVLDWPAAMRFYCAAFDAVETYRVPGGGVGRLAVDGAEFWVAEESKEHLNFSPDSLGGCSVRMLLIVSDPAEVCRRAVAAGATQVVPVSAQHGWILGRIRDPFGHHWEVARPSP